MALKLASPLDANNQQITNVGDPGQPGDAANKRYVDNAIVGLDWKASVRVASTGNVNLASPGVTNLDGVTLTNGDRVLLKDQTNAAENGIYTFNGAASAMARAPDADSSAKVNAGMAVSVEQGTINADKSYLLITNDPITVNTTALVFSVLGGGTPYTAGGGLTLAGNTFAVAAGTGLVITGGTGALAIDTAVVTRKYAANVGDGGSTTITVTHGLSTRDVEVQVYTNAAPYDTVLVEVQRTDANNVLLSFGTAPAAGAYRVVVVG